MTTFVGSTTKVTVGAVDLSDRVSSVTINREWDDLDDTRFGNTHRQHLGGLADGTVEVTFALDYAASETYVTLKDLGGTVATIIVKPIDTTIAATNPEITVTALVTELIPIQATIGEISDITLTWPINSYAEDVTP